MSSSFNSDTEECHLQDTARRVSPPPPPPPPSYSLPQLPSVGTSLQKLFVPFKYIVDPTRNEFRIYTRSNDGTTRKVFSLEVNTWAYIDIDDEGVEPERVIAILREELATDQVCYDVASQHYIAGPAESIVDRVGESARRVTPVHLTSYSVLSRFGHRFFDHLCEDGSWADGAASSSSQSATAVFRTVVAACIDAKTIAFAKIGFPQEEGVTNIHIWTTYHSFANDKCAQTAGATLAASSTSEGKLNDPLDITVRTFSSDDAIVDSFFALLETTDILVHYGEDKNGSLIARALSAIRRAAGSRPPTVEVFDLHDYVRKVYTDMPCHDFRDVALEVVATNTENGDAVIDGITAAAKASVSSTQTLDGTGEIFADIASISHSTENVTFFLEKIAARAFLIARLYETLATCIFELAFLSGCNISELTKPFHASRGVVAFVNPVASASHIVKRLPPDFMKDGIHGITYVTPLSSVLVDSLGASSDSTTRAVAERLAQIRSYGWIVNEVFELAEMAPVAIPAIRSMFGQFRGMIYSSAPILDGRHEISRQWSSILKVGLASWIGVSISVPSSSEMPNTHSSSEASTEFPMVDSSAISVGYFGIEDVCRHPFPALKSAVEMYLTLKICSNSNASPRAVAASTALTSESMAIRRRVTAANIATFQTLLPQEDVAEVSSGRKETVLKLWYRSRDQFTTNSIFADRKTYISIIEATLTRTFGDLKRVVAAASNAAAVGYSASSKSPPPPIEDVPPSPPKTTLTNAELSHSSSNEKSSEKVVSNVKTADSKNEILPLPTPSPPRASKQYHRSHSPTTTVRIGGGGDRVFPSIRHSGVK
jgi:hypothetical protein